MASGSNNDALLKAGLPLPGGLCERLWNEAQDEVACALLHPFVVSLASGTLPRSAFAHYVAQDAIFLHHFASAYAAALAKCERERDGGGGAASRAVLQRLLAGVGDELRLHDGYARRWDAAAPHLAVPSAATTAYTDFLMAVVRDPQSSVAEVLAAMVPCSRLYGFLGCALAAAHGVGGGGVGGGGDDGDGGAAPHHQYSEWVATYSSPDYLALPVIKEQLLDRVGPAASYGRLRQLYKRAMQLEVEFFGAHPDIPPPRRVAMMVVDFDDTCTARDTIGTLLGVAADAAADAAGAAAAAAGGGGSEAAAAAAAAARARVEAAVAELAGNYAAKHAALVDRLLPPADAAAAAADGQQPAAAEQSPSRRGGGWDEEPLYHFLNRLSDFDVEMNDVVVDSGVLRGLSLPDAARRAAERVELRPGCRAALAEAAARGVPVHVTSVNWSASMVAAALGVPARVAHSPDSPSTPRHHKVVVHANELEVAPSSSSAADAADEGREGAPASTAPATTTGRLSPRAVECARDKGRLFNELVLSEFDAASERRASFAGAAAESDDDSSNGGGERDGAVVYVGDSATDLLPLLAADLGVVVGSNALLRRVCAAFGVQLRPLEAAPLAAADAQNRAADAPPVLYEARSWHEVRAALFGPQQLAPEPAPRDLSPAPRGGGARGYGGYIGAAAAALLPAPVPPRSVPRLLSIAGSDSGGGAGLQADIKAATALGAFAMTAVTAITVQNSVGVASVHATPPAVLRAQIDAVLDDLGADAVKTGMLPNAEAVNVVADAIAARPGLRDRLVVDPVLVSTSGAPLADGGAGAAIVARLLPLAALLTPNVPEAEALLGGGLKIDGVAAMRDAARRLHALGARAVLIKGGHLLPSARDASAAPPTEVVDVLFDGAEFVELRGAYVATANTHGTGCTLASAAAAGLAAGLPLRAAVERAKAYLSAALAGSAALQLGAGPQRPFYHGVGVSWAPPTGIFALLGPGGGAATAGRRRAARVDLRMYAVTDAGCNARAGRGLVEAVAAAVAGGATVVQVREKDADGGDFLRAAREAVAVCRAAGVPLLINDRVDVAAAAGADGVHVGQGDLPASEVRRLLGPHAIVGVSVKTSEEAARAAADGADYVGCGAVYATGTKESSTIGLDGLAAVAAVSPLPVVAIGGIALGNAAAAIEAGGADGVAVVSAVFSAPDVAAAARELRAVVDAALERRGKAAA